MSQESAEVDVIIENLRSFKSITQKQVKLIVQKAK
jgi:hypothetical protein